MAKNTRLEEGLKEYNRKLAAGEIERTKAMNPIEKAKKSPKSLRSAINAKCYDCCCESRNEVTICDCADCPLHHLRPWQSKDLNLNKEQS